MSFLENKKCEICGKEVPDDFANLLCQDCYLKIEEDKKQKETEEKEIKESQKSPEQKREEIQDKTNWHPVQGIQDQNYKINEERDDKEQWATNVSQFNHSGKWLWTDTRNMYEYIKTWCIEHIQEHPQYGTDKYNPKFIWKPKIVDVGCGTGAGSNILSQEADFIWGIDKNSNSIKLARELFTRLKNGFYYSSQVSFDQIDIITEPREARNFMKFDVVVAIEIIEHISDATLFLNKIVACFDKDKAGYEATTYFISTPNRNSDKINKITPKNGYHVREWTSQEFYNFLSGFFSSVELLDTKGNKVEIDTKITPIMAKCGK
jgi:2-polyprenyl-3-methyl-5-hydroxy-6-metoxy-1,4-benzoquinol methylase